MTVKHYQELIAWQRAMDLVVGIYKVTRRFPPEELYALTSQLRRAAVSIPSNIAEGVNRAELCAVFDLVAETGRLISGLVRSLS